MEIYKASDTYSNLGRIGRIPLHHPGARETDQAGQGTPDKKTGSSGAGMLQRAALAKQDKAADAPRVNLRQARDITADISARLQAPASRFTGERLHDLSDVQMIRPRYV